MNNELDPSVAMSIDEIYKIDSSVLKEIEQRRKLSENANSNALNTIGSAPTKIEEPVKSDSIITNVERNTEYQYNLKKRELDDILNQLAKLDVTIDEIDVVISDLDKQALELVNEINSEINKVKAAYDFRIAAGCASNLIWDYVGSTKVYNYRTGAAVTFSNYQVIKNPAQEITSNYYGIKYYQKPLNRDYGFNVILEFNGTISIGSSNLAVITQNVTDFIQIGDKIADNIDNPQAFGLGSFSTVVGFGSTQVLGIQTSIYGSISTGSTVISVTGIGSTQNILIGNYVSNEALFDFQTKVVGFGTTVAIISYNDPISSNFISTESVVPSILLDKPSVGYGTDVPIGFGTYSSYPSLKLDLNSNLNLTNKSFSVIRMTEDISQDFDYTKSPIDPVRISIIDENQLSLGHKVEMVNNGESSNSALWREVLQEAEPNVGNGKGIYHVGISSWPYSYEDGYAIENKIYKFSESSLAIYTDESPTGISTTGPQCVSYASSITNALNNLELVKQRNIPKIQQLIAASSSLRVSRNSYEMNAWAYLQSASYNRSELSSLNGTLNAIRSIDYNTLQT